MRRGFQGELSSLLGLFSKASCGLTRFWVRNAFPRRPCFLDFEEDFKIVSFRDLDGGDNLILPVLIVLHS